jgi:hypothetical protein
VPCTAALLLAGIEPVLDVRGEQVWAQHQHPVIIGRHSVRLSDDVTVTVAEDEPVKVSSSSSSTRAHNQVLQQPSCTCRGMPTDREHACWQPKDAAAGSMQHGTLVLQLNRQRSQQSRADSNHTYTIQGALPRSTRAHSRQSGLSCLHTGSLLGMHHSPSQKRRINQAAAVFWH